MAQDAGPTGTQVFGLVCGFVFLLAPRVSRVTALGLYCMADRTTGGGKKRTLTNWFKLLPSTVAPRTAYPLYKRCSHRYPLSPPPTRMFILMR